MVHSIKPSRDPEDLLFSSILQLSIYLDQATRLLVRIVSNEGIQLDLHWSVSQAIVDGTVALSEILKAQPWFEKYCEQFDNMSSTMKSEIAQFLVEQDDTETPQATRLSHPLNFYALMLGVEAIMALTIFPFMASATGDEHSFSMYNEVHTKKRNRLGDD
eukprot:4617799-Ditylum_brightwellii.AAC.1